MTRVLRTREEIEELFHEQLNLLTELVDLYDAGKTVAAKSVASSVRLLVHDTPSSHALLQQVGLLDQDFYNTAHARPEVDGASWGSYSALVGVAFGGVKSDYMPNLDGDKRVRRTPFREYWNEVVFVDLNNNKFTRKNIVLAVANQDGGSHVDPGVDPKYKELSRNNSLGHFTGNLQNWDGLKGAELACTRQIAHEILKTLVTGYEVPAQNAYQGLILNGVGLIVEPTPNSEHDERASIIESPSKRQDPCLCGSGKKYKRCHGV